MVETLNLHIYHILLETPDLLCTLQGSELLEEDLHSLLDREQHIERFDKQLWNGKVTYLKHFEDIIPNLMTLF